MQKTLSADERNEIAVYEFFDQFHAREGYYPTRADAGRMMGVSITTVCQAVKRLSAKGFVVYTPRKWASVRLIVRACSACGAPITPRNAVYGQSEGKAYIRKPCSDCYHRQNAEASRRWNERHPGYNTRHHQTARRLKRLALD